MDYKRASKYRVYEYIIDYLMENICYPTVREICLGVGLSSTSTVHHHLQSLDEEGLISYEDGRIRVKGYKVVRDE